MGILVRVTLALLLISAAVPARAREARYERLDPNSYQSFVGNWTPETSPLCAVIRSNAEWDRVFQPAFVMGHNRPFSPPPGFWKTKAVLVVARVISSGDLSEVFHVRHLQRTANTIELDYTFKSTPSASSSMKWYLALAITKHLPQIVRFTENNHPICTLKPSSGIWILPALSAH